MYPEEKTRLGRARRAPARRESNERQIDKKLVNVLRGRRGRITRSDAVALSGLPVPAVEDGLKRLLAQYRSHLAVTESGELLYSFDPAMERRDAEPFGMRLERLGHLLWRGFVLLFKLAIITALVVYFVLFLALLVGLFVARQSGQGQRETRHGNGSGIPLWILWWLMPWPGSDEPEWRGRRYGGRDDWRRPRVLSRPRKKLYQQTFDYVFGPPRPRDEGREERETLAYLRARRGRITAAELVALRGLDLDRAEEEATRLMCDYDGEPEVTEDGVVVYVFRELRLTAGEADPRPFSYAWDRMEEPPPLTGNSAAANTVISLVNGFNLIMAAWLSGGAAYELAASMPAAETWLSTVPLVFSATFFAVPLGRLAVRALGRPAREQRNRRRAILREVFGLAGGARELSDDRLHALDPAEVARTLAQSDPEEQSRVRQTLDGMTVSLGGDVSLEPGPELGRTLFPRLRQELAAVQLLRSRAPLEESRVGEVVFDTSAELEEKEPRTLPPRAGPPRRLPSE